MTTSEIAQIANGRASSKGWMAQCPAHADRSPSLSIREGRDGRTLVRCFAGCEPAAIVQALGITIADLFADERPNAGFNHVRQQPSAAEVEKLLQEELARILEREAAETGFQSIAELTRHRNEARSIIQRRHSVQLKREVSGWWEVEPHCVDPSWPMCIDQATHMAAARSGFTFQSLGLAIHGLPRVQHEVLLYARELQRQLTKEPVLCSRPDAA